MNQICRILIKGFILLLLLFSFHQANAQRRSTSVNVSSNGKTTVSIKNGFGNNFSLEYKGDITLSDDDTDVIAISSGGYMEIKKAAFGNRRRIFMEPNSSGRLNKRYYVGGSEKSFDPDGKKWLAEILLEVVRTTTLGAEKRVNRMYRQGGAPKVLREVDKIASDHVKSKYIKLLLNKDLKESDVVAVLGEVATIDSDHHKASILKYNTTTFLKSENSTSSYIRTAGNINSDHHKADVLKAAISDGAISDTQMKALFAIADEINSDHHKSDVLKKVLHERNLSTTNLKLLIATTDDINSDHHKASVFKAALEESDINASTHHALLDAIDAMNSDHHIADVLNNVLKTNVDEEILTHLLRVVQAHMNSDSHRANVLKKVIYNQNIGKSLDAFLEAVEDMTSDHHIAEVFKQLSRKRFNESELVKILGGTASINSDHHHSQALMGFAQTVKDSGDAVKEAYSKSASKISSEAHYGRTLKAIQ